MGYSSNCRAITKMTTLTTFVVERSRHVCKVSPKIGGIKNTPLYFTYLLPKKTLCDTFNYQYYNLRSIQSRPFKAFAKIWSKLPTKKIMRKIRPSTHLSTKVLLSQYILVQQTRSILTFCLRNYGGTGWKIGAAPSPLIFLTGCRATLCLWQYDTKGPRCFGCSRPRQTQGIFGIMFKAEGVIWFGAE